VVESVGEVDMGDPQTLIDFVTWAVQKYPAQKYALILSDHGGGWTGGDPSQAGGNALALVAVLGERDRAFIVVDREACVGRQRCARDDELPEVRVP